MSTSSMVEARRDWKHRRIPLARRALGLAELGAAFVILLSYVALLMAVFWSGLVPEGSFGAAASMIA